MTVRACSASGSATIAPANDSNEQAAACPQLYALLLAVAIDEFEYRMQPAISREYRASVVDPDSHRQIYSPD